MDHRTAPRAKRTAPHNTPERQLRQQKKAAALEMRLRYWTEAQIATQLSVSQRTISNWLTEAFHADEEAVRALAPSLRAMEAQRTDALARRMLDAVEEDGDVAAAAVLVRLHMLRAKAYGLDLDRPDANILMGPIIVEVPSPTAQGVLGLTQTVASLGAYLPSSRSGNQEVSDASDVSGNGYRPGDAE